MLVADAAVDTPVNWFGTVGGKGLPTVGYECSMRCDFVTVGSSVPEPVLRPGTDGVPECGVVGSPSSPVRGGWLVSVYRSSGRA